MRREAYFGNWHRKMIVQTASNLHPTFHVKRFCMRQGNEIAVDRACRNDECTSRNFPLRTCLIDENRRDSPPLRSGKCLNLRAYEQLTMRHLSEFLKPVM